MQSLGAVHLLVVCLVAGMLGQVLSRLLRIPSIVFLLVIGIALGPIGAGVIQPERLGGGLEVLVRLGVAFILFEGSMALRLRRLQKVQRSLRMLVTVGILLTFATAAAAAHFIGGLPFRYALLFGSLVTVTGPTVIRPLVQRLRLRHDVAAVLEGEAILADPIGAILAAVCLEVAVAPGATPLVQLEEFGTRLGLGLGVGGAAGLVAAVIVRYRTPALEDLKPLLVLACALGCYVVSNMIREESGIMAVVAAGLIVQWGVSRHDRSLREFMELATTLMLSLLFILLAAGLRKERMLAEGLPGLVTVVVVMLVIRPLNIFLCVGGERFGLKEKLFLSWVAPRGIVAASVSSLGALILERNGHPDAHRVESLVFLIVFLTVFLQGGTAGALASALNITAKDGRSILIAGANAVARAVAEAYVADGKSVVLIDRNADMVDEATRAGLRAVNGDATEREILQLAGLDEADVFIGLTPSSVVNLTAAQVAIHDHALDRVWVALDENRRSRLDAPLEKAGAEVAFGRPLPFQVWQHQFENGRAGLIEVAVTEGNVPKAPVGQTRFSNNVAPIYYRRNGTVDLVRTSTRLQPGDRLTVLARSVKEDWLRVTLGVEPGG